MKIYRNLRQANLARVTFFNHTLEGWSPAMWACALAGEVGELCNLLKKQFRNKPGDSAEATNEAIADEIADIAIYLDLLAARLGIDVARAVEKKFNEKSREVNFPGTLQLFDPQTGKLNAICASDE